MSKLVLRDCSITVDGVDLSDHTSSVTITLEKEEITTTAFTGQGTERVAGLSTDSFELELQQDFSAAEVDATLWPLFSNETEFVVSVRPTSAVVSAENPEFSGTCVLLAYSPLTGSVGELSTVSITFPVQRQGIDRATS